MYVCLCKAVTEGDLDHCIETFGPDLDCVQRSCGAATDCGACLGKVEKILHAAAQSREMATADQA